MRVINDGPKYCHAGGTIASGAKKDMWGLEKVRNFVLNMSKMLKG